MFKSKYIVISFYVAGIKSFSQLFFSLIITTIIMIIAVIFIVD